MARWRVAGINFDHMHMGDLLREVFSHPDAEIVGICDASPDRMASAIANFALSPDRVFTDPDACLAQAKPDLAIICAATADHADYVEIVARHGVHVLVEKPFAGSVADADRMIAAMQAAGRKMAINWPLAWVPAHVTLKRLIDEGAIGEVLEIHFYDGNRGPLYHLADKVEVTPEEVEAQKPSSWWYKAASGGGSLRDYIGYGVTLGTWFLDGAKPIEVTSVVDETPGIEVDQHSITICRYARGLSKMETRWGTISDPWTQQPQPKCGFVVVGSNGSISSYDYEPFVTMQTRSAPALVQIPADVMPVGRRGPIEYMLDCIARDAPVRGPLDPALSRIGQQITDSAILSAREKRTVPLLP
jgi:glucose-fructose oxidoreductase